CAPPPSPRARWRPRGPAGSRPRRECAPCRGTASGSPARTARTARTAAARRLDPSYLDHSLLDELLPLGVVDEGSQDLFVVLTEPRRGQPDLTGRRTQAGHRSVHGHGPVAVDVRSVDEHTPGREVLAAHQLV